MQFALPPKASHRAPFARGSRASSLRRKPLQVTAIVAVAFCTFYIFLSYIFAGEGTEVVPTGVPKAVIVTVFDDNTMSKEYIARIKQNREDYAQRHGYANFFTNTSTYAPHLGTSPPSWSVVPAVRHAMTLYPYTPWLFSLTANALIMAPALSLHEHILNPTRLSSLMLKDIPVVPPDSVIHTFSHLKPDKVDLVLTQDATSLSHGSFLLRRGDWAKYFLDSWMDGLYRSYNFQKAEGHALEHLTQWHPTVLSHLVLIPQRIMNSYNSDPSGEKNPALKENGGSLYQNEDLLVRFYGCDSGAENRNCEKEMSDYWVRWSNEVQRLGSP